MPTRKTQQTTNNGASARTIDGQSPQSARVWVGAIFLCALAARALAAPVEVYDASGALIYEADLRALENGEYISTDDLRELFDGERTPVEARARYSEPLKKLTLQLRAESGNRMLRFIMGDRSVDVSAADPITLNAPPVAMTGTVWLPFEFVTDGISRVAPVSVTFDEETRELVIAEAASHTDANVGAEEAETETPIVAESIPYTSIAPTTAIWSEMKAALDPGHGGADAGAERFGMQEKTLALQLAREVARVAGGVGGRVVLTRNSDAAASHERRLAIGFESGATIYVSLHFNSSRSSLREGYRLVVYNERAATILPAGSRDASASETETARQSGRLADALQDALTEAGFQGERLQLPLLTLEALGIPAVHLEIAYLSNPVEAGYWQVEATRRLAAEAIWAGLAQYRP